MSDFLATFASWSILSFRNVWNIENVLIVKAFRIEVLLYFRRYHLQLKVMITTT